MEQKYDKQVYDNERNEKIAMYSKLPGYSNLDLDFEVTLWDVSFSTSEYDYPNGYIGFTAQWMRKKLIPLSENLLRLNYYESIFIQYREINDNDEKSLDYLCDNITFFNNPRFKGRRMSGNREDCIVSYNNYINCGKFDFVSYDDFSSIYKEIESDPIKHISRNNYNKIYLKSLKYIDDCSKHIDENIIITNYQDIEKYLPYIHNSYSYLYNNTNNFISDCEEWLEVIDKLEKLFDKMGHNKPFWTAFLPENIDKFEEVRVLDNDGNQSYIVARSKKYFYFMGYMY